MMIPFVTAPALAKQDVIQHGFFGRKGGVSSAPFDSLNCSPFSEDNAIHIDKNRQGVAKELGAKVLVTNKQVHGADVRMVGPSTEFSEIHEADGLVTTHTGIALGALGADCAPVLFADPGAGVIGAAHAGWQGAVAGITDKVVEVMCAMGANRESLIVVIGPAIQKQSYEVGAQFREKVMAQSPVDAANCFHCHGTTGNVHFDLPAYIYLRLQTADVGSITVLDDDTYADEEQYFSYRRACHKGEKNYGRQIGAISLI